MSADPNEYQRLGGMTMRELFQGLYRAVHGDVVDDLVFHPSDISGLFAADARIGEYGATAAPTMPVRLLNGGALRYDPCQLRALVSVSDADLFELIVALRAARLLPLSPYLTRPMTVLLGFLEEAARCRIRATRRRRTLQAKFGKAPWVDANLLDEVRSATGEHGQQRGRHWWFRCPLHPDRTPSLEVDPTSNLWHCFGCPKWGGVIAWRRAVGARS